MKRTRSSRIRRVDVAAPRPSEPSPRDSRVARRGSTRIEAAEPAPASWRGRVAAQS